MLLHIRNSDNATLADIEVFNQREPEKYIVQVSSKVFIKPYSALLLSTVRAALRKLIQAAVVPVLVTRPSAVAAVVVLVSM